MRAEGRQQELTVRAALGAGWGRIAHQLLVESVTLGMLGGAFGLAVAYGGLKILVAMAPANLPRLADISIDPVVLAFTLTVSLLSGRRRRSAGWHSRSRSRQLDGGNRCSPSDRENRKGHGGNRS